ncbi:MAG: glutamine--fructose-6-phosphate transaminase (isomerizing) [bacterium]
MCGIVAKITDHKPVKDFLISGLQKLETRGYDGYGIYILGKGGVKVGPKELARLQQEMESVPDGLVGIAHNRWATHGIADQKNSHPHTSGPVHIVHNGQVTNYLELKEELLKKGYEFSSDTDTEVLAHLIRDYSIYTKDLFTAVHQALLRLEQSTYGLVVIHDDYPHEMVVARMGSPVLIGTTGHETFVASQEGALFGYVENYRELNDGDIVLLNPAGIQKAINVSGELKAIAEYPIDPEHYKSLEKQSEFWMYDEMISAPETLLRALQNGSRARLDQGVILGGLLDNKEIWNKLGKIKRFIFVGCGTSYHAGKIMALAMEEIAGIEAQVIIASEWIYRTAVFDPETTCLVAISQSGETADVRKLLEIWKMRGILTLGIVNVPNTQIPKITDAGVYCHIGKEVGVASTKAFLGQVICGLLFVVLMAQQRGLSLTDRARYISEILTLPEKAGEVLKQESHIKSLVKKYAAARDFLFIGRKYSEPVALEGALKLKEISYIHAEGYASGEMKHGPLAMIDEFFPTFVIAPKDSVYDMTLHNTAEIHARNGKIIMVTTAGNTNAAQHADDVIYIPQTLEAFSPILSVIPTQLFAFFMALEKGYNPDQPRNLAKSVTVE